MSARTTFAPGAWPHIAQALGFLAPDAKGACTRADLILRPEGDWLALVDCSVASPGAVDELLTPGLWRVLPAGSSSERVHDLPQLRGLAGSRQTAGAVSEGALARFVDWADATRTGGLPQGWSAPLRSEVEEWFPAQRLHVRSGSNVARGTLVCEGTRLALVFEELASVPADLDPARRAWLDSLFMDAQRRWRLVRFGVDSAGRARAEVDLSGVPDEWAQPLVQLSLEALCWAVEWVLSPLSFVVDPSAVSRVLGRPSLNPLIRS